MSFPADFFDGLTQPPLVIHLGETLEVVEKDEHWLAFVLVINEKRERGWVPHRYLNRQKGDKKATVIKGYDTTTLDPSEGEVLTVLEEDRERMDLVP